MPSTLASRFSPGFRSLRLVISLSLNESAMLGDVVAEKSAACRRRRDLGLADGILNIDLANGVEM